MVDYKKVKEEIKGFNDIAELIRFAKLHLNVEWSHGYILVK